MNKNFFQEPLEPKLVWQDLYANNGTTSRAKIHGGWLVRVGTENSASVTFVSDPDHAWDGGSQDKLDLRESWLRNHNDWKGSYQAVQRAQEHLRNAIENSQGISALESLNLIKNAYQGLSSVQTALRGVEEKLRNDWDRQASTFPNSF